MRLAYSGSLGETDRTVQRPLLDRQKAGEGNCETDRGGNEDPAKGRRQIAVPGGDLFQRHDAGTFTDAAKHDGAEHGDDDRAAERAEEIQRAGRGAELVRLDDVLHDHGAHRIHRPEPATEHEEQPHDLGKRKSRRIGGQERQARPPR